MVIKKFKELLNEVEQELWPCGCLEDGESDPWSKYNDGYCQGIQDFKKEVNKRVKRLTK